MSCFPQMNTAFPAWSKCKLQVTPAKNETVHFDILTTDGSISEVLVGGDDVFEQLYETDFQPSGGLEKIGIIVSSNASLNVKLMLIYQFLEDSDVIPIPPVPSIVHASSYEYYLKSFSTATTTCSGRTNQFYLITAITDTKVEVHLAFPQSFTLSKYDVYSFLNPEAVGSNLDITGLKIVTDNPVSILSGSLCEENPSGISGSDSLVTHIKDSGSKHYVVPVVGNVNNTGSIIRVLSRFDGTGVLVGNVTYIINEGKFIEFEQTNADSVDIVVCSKDCNVYMVTKGLGNLYGTCMIQVVSSCDFNTEAYFNTPALPSTPADFLSIVVNGASPFDDIIFDGVPLNTASWKESSSFSTVWINIEKGHHAIRSESGRGFAVYVYGHTPTGKSYGFAVNP